MPVTLPQSTRQPGPQVPSGRIVLETPPELPAADGVNSMLTMLTPLLGSIGSIAMVAMMGTGARGWLVGGGVLFSSLGFVAVNGWRQRSQNKAGILAARREYLAYLADLRRTVRNAATLQRRAAEWTNPPPSALVYIAEERSRVWERRADAQDFLETRLGVSDQALCMELEEPELPTLAQTDPIAGSAVHRFVATHRSQRDLPATVSLRDYARIEVIGEPEAARSMVRAMVLQIVTWHGPEDVQLAVVAAEANLPAWDWVKWLPHAQSSRSEDAVGPARMIAPVFAEIEDLLPEGIADRPRFGRGGEAPIPHLILVLDGGSVSATNPVVTVDGVQGVTVIELPTTWGDAELPGWLRVRVGRQRRGQEEQTVAQLIDGAKPLSIIVGDEISIAEAEATARRLMPLFSATSASGDDQPAAAKSAELTDLLGLPDIRDIDLDLAWRPRLARDRLRVPIGLTTEGRPIELDIKESAQQGMGPHGLIIGATGSGKSEVLRTLVLALALTHSPEQLNFILVDFKGGATFAGMSGMPHVSAIITNLGEELSLVDRMQEALQGEMVRRQELLRAAGNFANVSDYEKARTSGGRTDLAPLPALLIVADEFSELLSAKPDFTNTFVAIGRLGRSLQVHLLMSSQRLEEGRLQGLDSHLSYRIGLRTFSAQESRQVLGVPDAYNLPTAPGSGLLKADTETMTQFRAAYVSGPPPRRRRARVAPTGERIGDVTVQPFTAAPVAKPVQDAVESPAAPLVDEPEDDRSQFDIAVELMRGRGPEAHKVWLPPLVTPQTFDELMPDLAEDPELGLVSKGWRGLGGLTFPLGTVDLPMEQRRENLTVALDGAGGHVGIVGGPRTGKSTVARSMIAGLSLINTPREVQFYVLDYGGGTFVPMAEHPHVAGVATRSEPDVSRRILAEIIGIINRRELYFRDNAIDSIETYRSRRAAGLVDDGYGDVFLIVDGWATVRSEFDAYEEDIQTITARGLTFGVHVVITSTRWVEIRAGIKDLLGTQIELRLGDPQDSVIARKAAENIPVGQPGRGITMTGHQMMAAIPRIDGDPDSATLADGVSDLIARQTGAWHGPPGPKVRLLPDLVTGQELLGLTSPEDKRILLAIDEADLEPWGVDTRTMPHLYLFGDIGSGKSSMLRRYINEIVRTYPVGTAKIFAIDFRRALLGQIPEEYSAAYLTTHEMATGGMRELAEFFAGRLPGPDVTADQLRERSWWRGAEGFIIVDDYDLVSTSQGNPLAPIVPLLAQAGDVGMHLVVVRRSGGASRAMYDPVFQGLNDIGTTGILLSGNPEEGALIGRVKPVQSVPGRAQIVTREQGLMRAQLAYDEPIR